MKKTIRKTYSKKPRKIVKRGTNWGSVAKTALKTAKWVASVVNVEYKYFLNGSSLTPQTWNGGITLLQYPSQGSSASQSTGDSIKIKDLTIRAEWNRNVLGLTSEVCRLIVFIDKENTIATGADFLQTTGSYASVYSEKNEDNRYSTKTLYDKRFIVNNADTQQRTFNINLTNINHHVHFVATTSTVKSNELKMLLICQSPTNGSQFTFISRATYVDN